MVEKSSTSQDSSSKPLYLPTGPLNQRMNKSTRWINDKKKSKKETARVRAATKLLREMHIKDARDSKCNRLEPHGLLEALSGASKQAIAVARFAGAVAYKGSLAQDLEKNTICRIEDLVAVVIALADCNSVRGFVGIVHLYARQFHKESVTLQAIDLAKKTKSFVKEFFDNFFNFHAVGIPGLPKDFWLSSISHLHPHSGVDNLDFSTFMDHFKLIMSNWEAHKTSPFFPMVGNLVSFLVTLNFLPQFPDGHVTYNGFTIFRAKVWDVQKELLDFTEMIAKTTLFFVERGHAAFISGDARQFLYTDDEAIDLDKEYALLVSAMPLLEPGRLSELDCGGIEGIESAADYDLRLDVLMRKLIALSKVERNKQTKTVLGNHLVMLTKVRTQLILSQKACTLRLKPYAYILFGGSSVAKTTLNKYCMTTVLKSNGFACEDTNLCSINDGDKFQSEITSYTTGVTVDDLCNTAEQFYGGETPLRIVIDMVNNEPKAALKADLASKGNVMMTPKCFAVTTNVKDLKSYHFSSEPVSILRRFNIVITAKLRPSHVDELGGPKASKMREDPNAWLLDVEKVCINRTYDPSKADGYSFTKVMSGASIEEVLLFLAKDSQAHFDDQRSYVETCNDILKQPACPHKIPRVLCSQCDRIEGDLLKEMSRKASQKVTFDDSHCVFAYRGEDDPYVEDEGMPSIIGEVMSGGYPRIIEELSEHTESTRSDILLPEDMPHIAPRWGYSQASTESGSISSLEPHMGLEDLLDPLADFGDLDPEIRRQVITSLHEPELTITQLLLVESANLTWAHIKKHHVVTSLYTAFTQKWREAAVALIGTTAVAALVAYAMSRRIDRELRAQGAVATLPAKLPDDAENVWVKYYPTPIPASEPSRGIVTDRLVEKIKKSIGVLYIGEVKGKRQVCNIFPLRGNVWLAPGHMFKEGETHFIEVCVGPPDCISNKFRTNINSKMWVRIPGTDFVAVRLVAGGDVPDLAKFFLTRVFLEKQFSVVTVYKRQDGSTEVKKARVGKLGQQSIPFGDKKLEYLGYIYQYWRATEPGLCMATAVLDTPTPGIVGFHTAGNTGNNIGVLGVITLDQVEDAILSLDNSVGLVAHSSGTFDLVKFGINYGPLSDPIKTHPVLHLPLTDSGHTPSAEIYGMHTLGTARFISGVRQSSISPAVEFIMDLSRIHGAPSTRQISKHWRNDIMAITDPQNGWLADILDRAVLDKKQHVFGLLTAVDYAIVHPYALDTCLAGADGIPAVDRLALNTSVGFPINKPKNEYITPSERIVEGITSPLDVDPIFVEEMEWMRSVLLRGERINTVYRGSLKDEPTKFTKDKIRVFCGSPVAFTLLVRQYYLSIIRLCMRLNKRNEEAVGINALGKEWGELRDYLDEFDGDNYVAGDYKAFDKNMSALINMHSFEIWIEIAKRSGNYDSDDIIVMRGIATEVCFPIVEYSGVFFKTFGMTPSGVPLTTTLNCCDGAIMLRYAFYAIYGVDSPVRFSDAVRAIVYGDDNAFKVKPGFEGFNHTSIAKVFSDVGIIYTMADKTSESRPYISLDEVSFLKRRFVQDTEIDECLAPLEEASISKSLHNVMHRKKSPVPEAEVCGMAIRSAAREYFHHGHAVYDRRREQLQRVAEQCDLQHIVGTLPTWDEAVTTFKDGSIFFDSGLRDVELLFSIDREFDVDGQ